MTDRVAVFCMQGSGHFAQLRPVVAGLVATGFAVQVFTDRRFAADVAQAGATMIDLFDARPLEGVDTASIPIPVRNVTFAGVYLGEIVEELRRLRPVLVVYETFAVVARFAAQLLGIPYINVAPGHFYHPDRFLPVLSKDPRVRISDQCHRAVAILRDQYGRDDASPFSYLSGLSPYLNIISQPQPFLTEEEGGAFAPAAYFGCLPWPPTTDGPGEAPGIEWLKEGEANLRLYVCLGTTAFDAFPDIVLAFLNAVADSVGSLPDVRALISLGGAGHEERVRQRITRPNVAVVDYTDQRQALRAANLFLTHHGLNSTHEAIMQGVPMLSYPIYADQPYLADRCQQLGIAIPLAKALRAPLDGADIPAALAVWSSRKAAMRVRLAEARSWEMNVIAERPAVIARIAALARRASMSPEQRADE
jgi:UDP:flavonoid glycosyltransferase YjiC (YdhE family)